MLFTLKLHTLHRLANDFGQCKSLIFKDAGRFDHLIVPVQKSYRTTSRRLSTRMHETVGSISSALNSVQRTESEEHTGAGVASVLDKRKSVQNGGSPCA